MKATEALDEIRKSREEIARKCDFDPRKLVDFYIERQRKKAAGVKQEKLNAEKQYGD
ncbi:MAG: hypothetical protein Q3M30_17995 [Candidatus Electrothrix sp. Rat3]|nr:hypothetical protein [Candidatus Electrothrix rattekaaiensis]